MDVRQEIARLYDLEYGRIDAAFRLSAVAICAVLLYLYSHWGVMLIWLTLYGAGHIASFALLRSRLARATPRDLVLAGYLSSVRVALFLWVSAVMAMSTDPALAAAGASGIGALLVFLIHRTETAFGPMWTQIALISIAIGWVVVHAALRVPDAGARIGAMLAASALIVYFALTVIARRRQHLEAAAAAQQLTKARKMEAVGQLAGGIAHDFNNILTAVIGNLDLYEVLEDPAERDTCVVEARAAAARAADLVRQLLAYARRAPMQVAPHDVATLLEQANALTRRLLPPSITMRLDPPAERLTVAVDQGQFLSAIVNLVGNARDAMPSGGTITLTAAPLRLETAQLHSDGAAFGPCTCVEITVSDTGAGIAASDIGRVTEPFFTTKPVGKGPGLGLSTAEGFARQSGGALSVKSAPSGTSVSLRLPLAAPAIAAA